MITGSIDEATRAEDTWFVPYAFYMLTKVRLYTRSSESYGFEVTFSPYPPDEFEGWPDETHTFGFVRGNIEEVQLDSDLTLL